MNRGRREILALLGATGLAGAAAGCAKAEPALREAPDPLDRLAPSGREPAVIRVGITPSAGQSTAALLAPLVEYLAAAHGLTAEVTAAPTYDALAASLRAASVDAAFFSPLAYVEARASLPAVAVATAARAGSPTYLGYLVVGEADSAESLADLQGKSIGWVDRTSTSGFLYPRSLVRSRGHDPDRFFGEQRFYGNHLAVIAAVASGEIEVGATASPFVDPDRGDGSEPQHHVRVVAKTSRIPLDCAVVHESLSRGVGKRWREGLLSLARDLRASERLAQTWGMSGFAPVEARHYDEIATVLDAERGT